MRLIWSVGILALNVFVLFVIFKVITKGSYTVTRP